MESNQDQESQSRQPNHSIALTYWDQVAKTEPNDNGVLGGFGEGSLPRVDSLTSRLFLLSLRPSFSTVSTSNPPAKKRRALDIGAGIGRVTRSVLLPVLGPTSLVDMVEPASGFVDAAHEASRQWEGKIQIWKMGIQEFWAQRKVKTPTWVTGEFEQDEIDERKKYDVIWCQWVLGHLTDDEFIKFFTRASEELVGNDEGEPGLIIVKENVCEGEGCVYDEVDGSVTRSDAVFRKLFESSGLVLVRQDVQLGFPSELFRVNLYALERPKSITKDHQGLE
ncbi:alpha-N-methyltransferase NTM1 [Melampsora americana]|nr:alpha-N-methyltransferase NTM1 [Melampsora americana]